MSQTYLILSLVGLAFTANALRPVPGTVLLLPSFFGGWLTMELAPHLLVLHVIANAAFLRGGVLDDGAGVAGLGVSVLVAAGLLRCIFIGDRARPAIENALREALGPRYLDDVDEPKRTTYDLGRPWRQLVMPFWFRHRDVKRRRSLSYGDVRRRNLLDVYHHRDMPSGAPVLLQVHGGGWVISNKNQQGKPIMLHMAARGWVCVAPNYRLSPRAAWPAHVVDVKRVIAWIREHIHEYGGDPSFVVITGGSAGGHLAALAALTPNDPVFQPGFEDADTTLQGAVPFYGIYDLTNVARKPAAVKHRMRMLERMVFKLPFSSSRAVFEQASPHYRVNADAPPFFVLHGEHDSLAHVEETRRFVARLREVSSQPVAYAELPGAQHAFDVFASIRTAHAVRGVERFCDWVWSTRRRERDTARNR